MDAPRKRIKKSDIIMLLEQNRQLRGLLEEWPAREIMMDFEKEWREKVDLFFQSQPTIDLEIE